MKHLSISLVVCFLIWQVNQICQLQHKRAKLNECYNEAITTYSNQWDEICKQNKKPAGCWLNKFQYAGIEEARDKKVDVCLRVFEAD